MVVQHNLCALNSKRQLGINAASLSENAEKLSSGYKINRASDDAAGLSISEKMRKLIRGLTQAGENAEDGISMVQIADGALEEVHDMLQRMNELCVQAANGTNSTSDRNNIQDEVTQIISEIDRVAQTTKFNELNLLDGRLGRIGDTTKALAELQNTIQNTTKDFKQNIMLRGISGDYAGQNVSLSEIENSDKVNLIIGTIQHDVKTSQAEMGVPTNYQGNEALLAKALQTSIVPQAVNSILSAYSPAFDYLKGSSIGIGLDIYSDPTSSTLALVEVHWKYYQSNNQVDNSMLGFRLGINTSTMGGALNFDGSADGISDASRKELEVTIVHEMMHAFMDEATTNGMIGVKDEIMDGNEEFPSWFVEGMAQTASGGYYDGNDWVNKTLGINAGTSLQDIRNKLSGDAIGSGSGESEYGTGYLACMYLGYLAGGSVVDASHIKSGLSQVLSEIIKGNSLTDVIKKLTGYSSISDFESAFANDGAAFVQQLTAYVGNGTGGVVGNLTTNDDILSDGKPTDNLNLFQVNTGNTVIYNTYPNGYVVFAGGGLNSKGNAVSGAGQGTTTSGTSGGISIAATEKATGYGVSLQIGADSDRNNKLIVYINAMNAASIGVAGLDVTSEAAATISIDRVAFAIEQVSKQRSALGAYQNRLEHTIKNLDNIVENTTSSESQIRDTDMNTELVTYSNNSILQQAGQAMLAQANQSNQGVLQLIV